MTIAISGDYGKPRPALVVQDDSFKDLASVVVLRLTSELHHLPFLRIAIEPSSENGLRDTSQVMVDKPAAVPKAKIGRRIGTIGDNSMRAVDAALGKFLGLAGF